MNETPRTLADEIQQSRPWSSPAEEAFVSVMRTAALIRRALSQAVEPCGISPAQYNVLRILRGAGPEGHEAAQAGREGEEAAAARRRRRIVEAVHGAAADMWNASVRKASAGTANSGRAKKFRPDLRRKLRHGGGSPVAI